MTLYFITGNKNKFEEIKLILDHVEQLEINLPEIQEINAKEIIKSKLHEAFKHKQGNFIVEDTSLYLDCLGGLPGPLIKWFLQTMGNKGIYDLVKQTGNHNAEAKTIIGYAQGQDNIQFFEGSIKGKIVFPNAKTDFGWDPIFQPLDFEKSFAEMTQEEKNSISMRKIAADKLKKFLEEN